MASVGVGAGGVDPAGADADAGAAAAGAGAAAAGAGAAADADGGAISGVGPAFFMALDAATLGSGLPTSAANRSRSITAASDARKLSRCAGTPYEAASTFHSTLFTVSPALRPGLGLP